MNNRLLLFLKECGVEASVINEIYTANPQMFEGNNAEIVQNIKIVIGYGFPDFEIGELLLLNPNFVFNKKQDLEERLKMIDKNVYVALMENPNLI